MIASELRRSGSFKTQFDNKSQVSTQGEQSLDFPSCQSFNFTHDKQRHRKTVGCKVKSSLCKNFTSTGNCPYGNRCQFAHGAHELRINEDTNSSYKTKECNSYFKKGYCQYGYRCNFLHSIKEEPCLRSECKNSLKNDDWKDVFEYVRQNESSKLMRLLQ